MSVILCTAGYDHTIRFWEALSGLCSRQIPHTDSQINRLCISPNKQYLAVAGKCKVYLYACRVPEHNPRAANTDAQSVLTFEGHTNNITGVAFHCDTKWMVTSSEDGTVKIWDTRSASIQRNYNHGCPVNDVVIHPNQGELISCDRGGNIRIWDLGENKCSHQLIPEDDISVSSVTVASDGSLLCAGNNKGNVYVWRMLQTQDTTSLIPVCKFHAHGTFITRVLLSPDVRSLATCSADHTARIWKVDASAAPSSADGPATTSYENSNNLQNLANRDSSTAAYRTANTNLALQHTHSQNQVAPAQPPSHTSTDMAGSNDGGEDGNLRREPAAFPLEATLGEHQRWVWDCAFSADSAYLVTACSDHYARLWDLAEQKVIRQYQGHHRGLVCVALNDYSEMR